MSEVPVRGSSVLDASSSETCGETLGDRPCRGLPLPRGGRCLAHAAADDRRSFLSRGDESPGPAPWPAQGYLVDLRIDSELLDEILLVLRRGPCSVDFHRSTFACAADFRGVHFHNAAFTGATFECSADFRRTRFDGPASFFDVRFGTYGQSFDGAHFADDATFACSEGSEPERRQTTALRLSGVTFSKGCRFDRREFRHRSPKDDFSVFLNDAHVTGDLIFHQTVSDGVIVLDRVATKGPVTVLVPPGGRVSLRETVLTDPLTLTTRETGTRRLEPASAPAQLIALTDATLEATLTLGEGIALTHCELVGATGLDHLRVTATDPQWPVFRRRRAVADEIRLRRGEKAPLDGHPDPAACDPRQVEAVYRQLRAALETTKATPAAADFYYGEMEMRRLACRRGQFDRILLAAYKLTSGYGLRAYRSLAVYLVVLLVVTFLLRFRTGWFVADPVAAAGSAGLSFSRFWDVFAIAARSSVSFLSAVTTGLTAAGTLLFVLLRLAGPAAVALTILALRARVHR